MNLSEIREKFIQQSGRYDLVNPDGSDNGANFYINAGQKYLDKIIEKHDDIARVFRYIEAGQYYILFEGCRAIHQVGVGTSESFNWLERKSLPELRENFSRPYEYIERATPNCFAPAYLRPANPGSESLNGIVGYMDVIENSQKFNGIILAPPADQNYHVEVWGKFYSDKLVEDSDESYWSMNFDYVLIMAAQRALEMFYRNTQGVNDWSAAIRSEVLGIEQDYVDELYYGVNQLEG